MEFLRFPHTPHLSWLGEGQPRDDKVLSPVEARELLDGEIVVEEKLDGANLGFSVSPEGRLLAQNRGSYLSRGQVHPQFKPLFRWLQGREDQLAEALFPNLILFGEWCYALHSVRYGHLPDWYLAFDVYDREAGEFWSVDRRDELVARMGITPVPHLARGRFELDDLIKMLGQSRVSSSLVEGLYVRREQKGVLAARAKLVRPEFVQAIEEHWSKRPVEPNRLSEDAARRLNWFS